MDAYQANSKNQLDSIDLLARRGIIHAELNNYFQALQDLQFVNEHQPGKADILFTLANIKLSLMELIVNKDGMLEGWPANNNFDLNLTYEGIIDEYNQVFSIDEDFYFIYYNRAYAYFLKEDYETAIWDFSNVLYYNPSFADAIYNRGLLYILTDKTDKGCYDMSRAGELGITEAYNVIKRYCGQ